MDMDMAMRNPKVACCGCSTCTLVVLLILSFSSLEFTEIGLNYSAITNTVEDRGYTAGIHFLGPGHSFIKFPSTVQTIQFSEEHDSRGKPLRSRTSDGLEVALEVSFQYQLSANSTYLLYMKYGPTYENIFVTMSIDDITRMATQYSAAQFFRDRYTIGNDMESSLKDVFTRYAYASIPFFQLRSVKLPPQFENAIQDTEVKKQDNYTATAEWTQMEVQMQTKVLLAEQQAITIGVQADATAQSTMLNVKAYVKQFNLSQALQAQSFAPLYKESLNSSEKLLLEYMSTRAMRDHPDHLSVIGMPDMQPGQ